MPKNKVLTFTLWFIAMVQFALGVAFLFAPQLTSQAFGLSAAPGWTSWLFGMMAARFLGFAYGMALAARDPAKSVHWIKAMIGIQAIDWIVTIYYVSLGAVTLAQVSTASFLPLIFVILLSLFYPKTSEQASLS